MAEFLFKANYNAEGVKGIAAKGGTARKKVIEQMMKANGGKLEALYFVFGDADVYAFGELPDNESAAAVALAVNQSGVTTVSTVVLLTPEEVDSATKKKVDYTAPGK